MRQLLTFMGLFFGFGFVLVGAGFAMRAPDIPDSVRGCLYELEGANTLQVLTTSSRSAVVVRNSPSGSDTVRLDAEEFHRLTSDIDCRRQ